MAYGYSAAKIYMDITSHVDNSKTFTTVILSDGDYTGIGTAKRNPNDKFDQQLGVWIATARALVDLAGYHETAIDLRLGRHE